MLNNKIKILGISGSLRTNSSATSVLKQTASLLPANTVLQLYEELGRLPHFDDSLEVPAEVIHFRQLVAEADGVLICTPEYAFGVPGSLKNALDWTVGSGEFVHKPVAVITAASVGKNAHASLLLTLSAITANVAEDAKLLIPFIRAKLNKKGEINDPALLADMQRVVNAFVSSIEK
ncbi:NAD(P)H-dependent oxidoreductase [Panacibacter ginsenosidivorans]|uniref:NAD(P)H-dependent oxidoreductase n=1 Tax=Panacibacter ginsenosidivorans TaxID=1813871 RepID=A0A5B8VC90_9BACT|nr:NAD(P)H-dependent oxidoreductase [Panacibacter ginsenosidivorans]QEC68942.1 NAD(P)H-dependent oxidoreductase [Panacibacter ginsenosidivorans]